MLEFLQHPEEYRCRGMDGDSGVVMEDVCGDGIGNIGGWLVLMLMR